MYSKKKMSENLWIEAPLYSLFFLHDPELIYSVWVFPDQCAVKIVHFCPQRFRSQFRLTNMSEKSLLGAQSIFLISVPALKKNCIRYCWDELLKKNLIHFISRTWSAGTQSKECQNQYFRSGGSLSWHLQSFIGNSLRNKNLAWNVAVSSNK